MSSWRPARIDEISRLWPAVRSAHLAPSVDDFVAYYSAGPWRVRVSDSGDVLVLKRWRAHLDVLAVHGAWAPAHRMAQLVTEACRVARTQGYDKILSPLVPESALSPYLERGLREHQHIVALQALPEDVLEVVGAADTPLRAGSAADVSDLVSLDLDAFDEFWRYGSPEFAEVLSRERVVLADSGGGVIGYATSSISGSTCTVGRLAVKSSHRRRGIGAALLRDAAAWGRASGTRIISLCTQEENSESRTLYWRAGFTEIAERYALAMGDLAEGA